MEIKTLKDLRGHGKDVIHPDFSDCLNYDDQHYGHDIDKVIELLKQEAIKHIKDFTGRFVYHKPITDWIQYFFNITEEDLKDE